MAQQRYKDPITFDTLSYAKKLQAVGFTPEQAEVQAETFLAIVQEQLVSKRDLKELEKEMKFDAGEVKRELKVDIEKVRLEIEEVKRELKVDIANIGLEVKNLESRMQNQTELLRRDLKIWFGGMLVVTVSVLSGMMTLIVHVVH